MDNLVGAVPYASPAVLETIVECQPLKFIYGLEAITSRSIAQN